MLKLICGGFGAGKTTEVLSRVAARLREPEKRGLLLLLVPEQETVNAEGLAAETLPPSAPLRFEVQNFSRLANQVFRTFGGLSYRYADKGTKSLLMWHTLRLSMGMLKSIGGEINEGMIDELLSAVTELRFSGVDISALEAAAKTVGEETELGKRASDLSAIAAEYESQLALQYDDAEKDLDKACAILYDKRYFAGGEIFIDGFTSFTAPQVRLIRQMLSDGADVTVTLPLSDDGEDAMHLSEVRATFDDLKKNAEKVGSATEILWLSGNRRAKNAELAFLSEHLFRLGKRETYEGTCGHISVLSCVDREEEAERVASLIKKAVQEGVRYREIAVVARNADDYEGILDHAFRQHGIPSFFSYGAYAEEHPLIRLIYGMFSLVLADLRREDVIGCLKTGLFGIDRSDCDRFENYVNTWRIRGKRFVDGQPFSMNPDGYTQRLDDSKREMLDRVNEVKRRFTETVQPFIAGLSEKTLTVESVSRTLWDFLNGLHIKDRMTEEIRQWENAGDEQAARRTERLYGCLLDALDGMVETVGEETVTVREYVLLLRLMLRGTRLSVIPTSADAVTVGNADMLRTSGIRRAFLIGCNEDVFPMAVRDRGFFDQTQRRQLEKAGVIIGSDPELSASKELFYFARAASAASEDVCFSYVTVSSSGTEARIGTALPFVMGCFRSLTVVTSASLPAVSRVYDKAGAAVAALTPDLSGDAGDAGAYALARLMGESPDEGYVLSPVLSKETTDVLFERDIGTAQARLETYAQCRFLYYCRYLLRLQEERTSDFQPSDIGNFIHDILDELVGELSSDGQFRTDISDGELDALLDTLINGYIGRICPEYEQKTARLLELFRRLRRSLRLIARKLVREFSRSRFVPVAHEKQIGGKEPDALSPIVFPLRDGRTLSLYGTIDRVDTFRTDGDVYVRVVDYKTAERKFSRDDMEKGLNLQLLLYLYTVCEQTSESVREAWGVSDGGSFRPAGILYDIADTSTANADGSESPSDVAAPDPAMAIAEKKLTQNGVLLKDDEILAAMYPAPPSDDGTSGTDAADTSEKKKKKNAKKKEKTSAAVVPGKVTYWDETEFADVREQIGRIVTTLAEEMCGGQIAAGYRGNVKKFGCEKCGMRSVCRRFDETDTTEHDENDEE